MLLLLLTAVACAPASSPTETPTAVDFAEPTPGETEPTATTETTATMTPIAGERPEETVPTEDELSVQETVIEFSVEGGFAGINRWWLIYEDGRVEGDAGQAWQVDPQTVAELLAVIEETGFFDMVPSEPEPFCCDFFTFTLSARKDLLENTITISEADPSMTAELEEAITAVQQFVSSLP